MCAASPILPPSGRTGGQAFYELSNPEAQIKDYVEDVVRSTVPKVQWHYAEWGVCEVHLLRWILTPYSKARKTSQAL